jgi:hypothetical protein
MFRIPLSPPDKINDPLRAIRAPVLMIRAETGFTPSLPPLYPESLMSLNRTWKSASSVVQRYVR